MTIPEGMGIDGNLLGWLAFGGVVGGMLLLDLLAHRRRKEPTLLESAGWSALWIGLAVAFGAGIGFVRGWVPAGEFFTAFVLEKALSVDNLFVFLLLFSFFAVPARERHRVLFWGVLGALLFRGVFIMAGVTLLERFHWLLYVFGGVLLLTSAKLIFKSDDEPDPSRLPVVRLFRRFVPTTDGFRGGHFLVRESGRFFATPLLMVLVAIEVTDIVFAFDSIPAVFGVTTDPFLIYSSNIFAILGLRALYSLLAGVLEKIEGLDTGLAFVLAFVGVKMLVSAFVHVPIGLSFAIISVLLASPPMFLYFRENGGLSFTPPAAGDRAFDSYVSDPRHPVPYRRRPVQRTYDPRGSGWYTWLTEDQRFVDNRPDVLTWRTEPLTQDVTIAGNIAAELFAATTGSDADWVVKLIDVYPDSMEGDPKMGGYELMVASDILRGRYRTGFDHPTPIRRAAIEAYRVDLHQQSYRFERGHRIMVQVQSTWFPLYDRNPQTFVRNIFEAHPADFRPATERVYRSAAHPSHVTLPVLAE